MIQTSKPCWEDTLDDLCAAIYSPHVKFIAREDDASELRCYEVVELINDDWRECTGDTRQVATGLTSREAVTLARKCNLRHALVEVLGPNPEEL